MPPETVPHLLYLIRHGETEWSAAGRHTGVTDVPLTANGEKQAVAVGRILTRLRDTTAVPALVLCSPRQRAIRTAELAGLTDFQTTEQLAEWNYGEYEGRTTTDIQREVPGWTVWTHPVAGGESATEVQTRARALLDQVRGILNTGDVVLVGHGHFSRVLITTWLGMTASDGVRFALEPAGIATLGYERGVEQLRRLNVSPLEV